MANRVKDDPALRRDRQHDNDVEQATHRALATHCRVRREKRQQNRKLLKLSLNGQTSAKEEW